MKCGFFQPASPRDIPEPSGPIPWLHGLASGIRVNNYIAGDGVVIDPFRIGLKHIRAPM